MQICSLQETSTVSAAVGPNETLKTRPGATLKFILQQPTVNTSKCRVKQWLPPGMTMQL
jgi:hypothetical protein